MTAHVPDASAQATPNGPEPAAPSDGDLRRRLVRGEIGGLIATTLMTLYRSPVFHALPPTADFWAEYVGGGDPEAYPGTGLLLHLLYGGAAGGLFSVMTAPVDRGNGRRPSLAILGLSVVYGLALSVFGTRVVVRRLLGAELDPDEAVIFHAGHLVYGLALGTWVGVDRRVGQVYE